ncbi:MAG TPA: FKBP-type peptidyl-prolyl cis-trans isomerase [Bacteroidia bacterium]|nr:FKBP-type peptidyl-prolyl cis-trans isomerase [Bacteroidia bacterium]
MVKRSISFISARWFPVVIAITLGCNVAILLIPSCKSSNERSKSIDKTSQKEDLIKNQQTIMRNESEDIDSYISRRKLKMNATQTGLRYQIYNEGAGKDLVQTEDWVKINYQVSLLDGSKVYSSDSTGALEFQVGKSDVASGLQEGIKFMNVGDKAIFILPSHLAYGLTGDGDQIKHYETLVIDAELLSISKTK